jgi:hypothetical protein
MEILHTFGPKVEHDPTAVDGSGGGVTLARANLTDRDAQG